MKKIFLATAVLLGSPIQYTSPNAMENTPYDEVYNSKSDTGLINRRMFILDQDFAAKNKILMTKGISAITEYGDRDMVVVRLIDGSEVPFYESSGHNSGLPASWLPFFGISTRNGGWIHKNYSFSDSHGTGDSTNPLYHCGCYALAQICNELDSLPMDATKAPWSSKHKDSDKIPFINAWIGGRVLESHSMPQNMGNYTFAQKPPLQAIGHRESPFVRVEIVDTKKTTKENLFGSFREKKGTKITIKDTGEFFNTNRRLESSKLTFMHSEIRKSESFMHDLKDFMSKMEKTYGEDVQFRDDFHAFKQLIGQTESFINICNKEDSTQNKVNAYLGLQMVKRFSFNTFYKMLTDINILAGNHKHFTNKIILSSRAAWLSIKHQDFTFSGKKLNSIRELLQKIKLKSSSCFDLLCYEHPVQIERFSKGMSYDRNRTIVIKNDNEKLLKAVHNKALDIYDNNFNDEMSNVQRLVEKGYHKKSAIEIVEHYGDKEHLLGLDGVSETKNKMIQVAINDIKISSLKSTKGWAYSNEFYTHIFENLAHLKNIINQSTSIKATEKARGIRCVQQLATWFYFDALTNIKKFD